MQEGGPGWEGACPGGWGPAPITGTPPDSAPESCPPSDPPEGKVGARPTAASPRPQETTSFQVVGPLLFGSGDEGLSNPVGRGQEVLLLRGSFVGPLSQTTANCAQNNGRLGCQSPGGQKSQHRDAGPAGSSGGSREGLLPASSSSLGPCPLPHSQRVGAPRPSYMR